MLACSSHNSKAPNFLPLQKSQPIASGAPAQPQPRILLVNRGCHLPGLRPGRHAFIKSLMSMIQLTSPEKPLHRKWKVTRSWDSSRGGTAEGRPARGYGRPVTARGKIGLICLHLGGGGGGVTRRDAEGRKRVWSSETFRKLFPPRRWKGKSEANACFLSRYSVVKCFVYTWHRGAAHQQMPDGAISCTLLEARRMPLTPPGDPCPKQLQEWAPSAGGNKDSAKCGKLQVSAETCKSPTCGP